MKTYKKIVLLYICSLLLLVGLLLFVSGPSPLGPAGPFSRILPEIIVGHLDHLSEAERQSFYQRSAARANVRWEEIESGLREPRPMPGALHIPSRLHPGLVYVARPPRYLPVRVDPGVAALVFILILMAGSAALLVYSLKPLSDLAGAIRSFGQGATAVRFKETPHSYETALLADAFNNMAEQIEAARQRDKILLRAITHELRNPLMALRWSFEVFRKKNADRAVSRLDDSIRALEKTMAEVQLVTRGVMEAGGRVPVESLDLLEFLRSFIQEQLPQFAQHKKQIRLETDLETMEVPVNPDHLSVILKNLARNFMQYEPAGAEMILKLSRRRTHIEISIPTSLDPKSPSDDPKRSDQTGQSATRARAKGELLQPQAQRSENASQSEHSFQSKERRGEGIGLTIAAALAESMGWQFSLEYGVFHLRAPTSDRYFDRKI
ncbi:MAG: HAMP domain-containing histidine kinase [Leptospiraceae bacterium]|nr:HAMP domain-containing histidine kinase [Leptospiraceae bacterium]